MEHRVPVARRALRQEAPSSRCTLPARRAILAGGALIPSISGARGATVVRDYAPERPRTGTVIVRGPARWSACPGPSELERAGINAKSSARQPQLFSLQEAAYRDRVLSPADRADSMVITTQARVLMHDWLFNKVAEEYALSADWDDRWRKGGALDELVDEAHLSPRFVLEGIERFARDREARLGALPRGLAEARA